MKINTIKNIALGLFLASVALVGCKEEIDPAANAVATESPSVTFAATNAPEQVVPVYADGEWVADCEADWVTISPMSGNGAVDVTISVTDNLASDGTVAAPRQANVIFRGKYIERQGELIVYQKGDNYRDAKEMSIADAAVLEDGKFVKIPEAQIVAAAADGIVVKDASALMFVTYKGDVKVGDKVFIAGEKVTNGGIASVIAGQVDVLSSAEVSHPTPIDLLTNLDPANADKVLYVTVQAGLLGRNLQFETSVPVTVTLLDPAAGGVDLDAVNMHNVKLQAYFVGLNGTTVNLVVTNVEDLGLNDDLKAYFFDDFSWMKPFLDVYAETSTPVGDAVGTDNPSAEAPNLKTNGGLAMLMEEFYARGYEDLNPDAKVIYPQAYYWKFGKTSNHGGIKLPAMELEGGELINAELDFDWSPHMTGSGNIDKVSVVVELEGAGFFDNGTKISDPFPHSLEKGDLNWHHVTVLLKGVNNTTRVMIRPLEFASATPDQQRWHLDNVKVSDSDIPYKDPVYANVTVSEEIVTFEGTPLAPVELKINSDYDWTLTKGFDTDWFSIDVLEGLAGEETTVKVTCQPSTLNTLRKGTMTLASADTRKTIHVVQSAAGGELEPLISIIGGNSGNTGFDAGSFKLAVQSNVAYEVEADASWVTAAKVETKAIVETSEVVVNYEANAVDQPRTARIRVFNADLNIESVYTLTQAAYETGIYFFEDFSWVAPWADAYGSGDSVGEDNASGKAPNVYTQASHQEYDGVGYANDGAGVEGYPSFLAEYANRGYEDVNPSVTSFYTQKYYLKFGATSKHTGIKLPAMELEGAEATDVVLSFDWSAHMTGSGNIDKVQIVVELAGDGVCADSQTKISLPVSPDQEKGDLKWQNVKFLLKGVNNATRITIRPTVLDNSDGVDQKRWYIDNIKVAKPKPTVLAAWDLSSEGMASYVDTWGGLDPGTYRKDAGDGGLYVAANAGGNGKLTYVQIDKNEIDVNGKARNVCGATGEPYVEGQWPGDSWNLTAEQNIPAGSIVAASFYSRTSGTGMKYWLVEYLDGDTWKPAMPTKTEEIEGQTVTYNVNHNNTTEFHIQFAVTTTVDMAEFKIRETCLVNTQASGKGPLEAPNGGTIRIKGGAMSPVIVMY